VSGLVRFVDSLPPAASRGTRWRDVRATLAGKPGQWALIDAKGGYPRQALKALGCEVKVVEGRTYARWPEGAAT
jgi:hypothetical protein